MEQGVTDKDFQRRCLGHDRCEICAEFRLLISAYDRSIGAKLLEIEPLGRETYACRECVERLERTGHLGTGKE